MSRQHLILLSSGLLLLSAAITNNGPAHGTTDFGGTWVSQLENRILMMLALTPSAGMGGQSTGVSNPEMKQIFEADQRDRQPGVGKIDWAVVDKADAVRREATRKLLVNGKLHTGEDFERAAFVFQHGETPDDYLLAHTLAMVAVAKGHRGALWIEAATLDRYLNFVHQPQIYGTQFFFKPNEPTTQEPYNRTLIPDSLRLDLGVPSQAAQEEQRKRYDAERSHR